MTNNKILPPDLDSYLFQNGLTLDSYFVRGTPFSEAICYPNAEGKEFYLTVNNDDFEDKLREKLVELGAEVIKVGES